MRVYAQTYYKHRCKTDSNFRAKMNEIKKVAYRERKIKECGGRSPIYDGQTGKT